jgi:hypothetical protein
MMAEEKDCLLGYWKFTANNDGKSKVVLKRNIFLLKSLTKKHKKLKLRNIGLQNKLMSLLIFAQLKNTILFNISQSQIQ